MKMVRVTRVRVETAQSRGAACSHVRSDRRRRGTDRADSDSASGRTQTATRHDRSGMDSLTATRIIEGMKD